MIEVYLSTGSNIGDRLNYLQKAKVMVEEKIGPLLLTSPIYETEPWGNKDQGKFLNQVLKFQTDLRATELLNVLRSIELEMGRERVVKWGPRKIDLDILFYGSEIIDQKELIVPHPQIVNRRFILAPLCDLAADFFHPGNNQSIEDLLKKCSDPSEVSRISD